MKRIPLALLCAAALTGCATTAFEHQAKRMSTPELQLRHRELAGEMSRGGFYFHFGGGLGGMPGGSPHEMDMKEQHAIDVELLHRYLAGDKGAYLQEFGGSTMANRPRSWAGIENEYPGGNRFIIRGFAEGSHARSAGLQIGDEIITENGMSLGGGPKAFMYDPPGESVRVTYLRDGIEHHANIKTIPFDR